jgi:hypothetical protein
MFSLDIILTYWYVAIIKYPKNWNSPQRVLGNLELMRKKITMRQPGQFWGLNMDKNITILGSFLAKNLPGLVNIQKTDGKITIEIVSFPMKHGGSFHSFLYVYKNLPINWSILEPIFGPWHRCIPRRNPTQPKSRWNGHIYGELTNHLWGLTN